MLISGKSSSIGAMAATMSAIMGLVSSAATAATPQAIEAESGPGFRGEVWVQPFCPPGLNCTDVVLQAQPLKGHALLFVHTDGLTTGRAYTNAEGRYLISLPNGLYQVKVANGNELICPDVWARVSGSKFRIASFVCAAPVS